MLNSDTFSQQPQPRKRNGILGRESFRRGEFNFAKTIERRSCVEFDSFECLRAFRPTPQEREQTFIYIYIHIHICMHIRECQMRAERNKFPTSKIELWGLDIRTSRIEQKPGLPLHQSNSLWTIEALERIGFRSRDRSVRYTAIRTMSCF